MDYMAFLEERAGVAVFMPALFLICSSISEPTLARNSRFCLKLVLLGEPIICQYPGKSSEITLKQHLDMPKIIHNVLKVVVLIAVDILDPIQ